VKINPLRLVVAAVAGFIVWKIESERAARRSETINGLLGDFRPVVAVLGVLLVGWYLFSTKRSGARR
jgi:hypothetical protein